MRLKEDGATFYCLDDRSDPSFAVVLVFYDDGSLTQQQADTVICIVLRPPVTTSLRYSGRWTEEAPLFEDGLMSAEEDEDDDVTVEDDDLASRSICRGFALTETCTEPGQFVFMARSSWWKHFS